MNEANGIQNIISIYSNSLIVLSQYDRNSLEFYDLNDKITYEIQFEEALLAIQELKVYLISKMKLRCYLEIVRMIVLKEFLAMLFKVLMEIMYTLPLKNKRLIYYIL